MKQQKVIKGAAQRYLNALWHLYSKAEPIHNMNSVSVHHKISKNFGKILKAHNYVRKENGLYVYLKADAPTIHDAKYILKKCTEENNLRPSRSLPKPLVKKKVKMKKQPNIWFYMAVIAMCTTLVTIALVLLK